MPRVKQPTRKELMWLYWGRPDTSDNHTINYDKLPPTFKTGNLQNNMKSISGMHNISNCQRNEYVRQSELDFIRHSLIESRIKKSPMFICVSKISKRYIMIPSFNIVGRCNRYYYLKDGRRFPINGCRYTDPRLGSGTWKYCFVVNIKHLRKRRFT